MADKSVPYYTTDDKSQWVGYVCRQKRQFDGRCGFSWLVFPPFGELPVAFGWEPTQDESDKAMREALERCKARCE